MPRAAKRCDCVAPSTSSWCPITPRNLGVLPRLAAGDPGLLKSEDGQRFFKVLAAAPALPDVLRAKSLEECNAGSNALGTAKSAKGGDYGIDDNFIRDVWESVVAVAEKHNDPGRFTAFVGYEYSSGSPMLHRNVMFVGEPAQTLQARPFSAYDSRNPEDLWAYLESYREATGSDVISIPHNSNLSRGSMFRTVTYEGKPLSSEYARIRSSIEPIIEVTQIKGDSDTLPFLPTMNSPITRPGLAMPPRNRRPRQGSPTHVAHCRRVLPLVRNSW